MMNAYIKLCRHLATIDGFPFIMFICDEQRPETWGADARDLASVGSDRKIRKIPAGCAVLSLGRKLLRLGI